MDSIDLKRLLEKLGDIEKKIDQNQTRVMMEETTTIADEGEWGGKSYFQQAADGGIIKQIRIPVCDICGRRSENFNSCTQCRKKICPDCSIMYLNRIFCLDCLQELLPLTKQEYKVLMMISCGINDSHLISSVTRIKREEVGACKQRLKVKGFIKVSGFLFFTETEVLEKGIEALNVYSRVYGKEEDVLKFESELRRVLVEKA